MINANLKQFLDTGMLHDCSLYYKGYLYYLNGYIDLERKKEESFIFTVDKIKSEVVDGIYQKRVPNEDGIVTGEILLDLHVSDEYEMKKIFLNHQYLKVRHFGK